MIFISTSKSYLPKTNTIAEHLLSPELSFDKYVREKRLALSTSIASRKKVYLDTKFWIYLRDAHLGKTSDQSKLDLLDLFRGLAAPGKAVFPISETIFIEVLKQTDQVSLAATSDIIDQLSEGITLIHFEERVRLELLRFFYNQVGICTFGLDDLVWTKLAYVLGFQTPDFSGENNTLFSAIQKALVDELWLVSLGEMINIMGISSGNEFPTVPDVSGKLNQGKFANADGISSFMAMLKIEIAGCLDGNRVIFQELSDRFENIDENILATIVHKHLESSSFSTELPSLAIYSGLHAAARWDRGRKFKPNDMRDFLHATAALPYCDYFLTEKGLRHLVSQRNLGYDTNYSCIVVSDIGTAIKELSTINK